MTHTYSEDCQPYHSDTQHEHETVVGSWVGFDHDIHRYIGRLEPRLGISDDERIHISRSEALTQRYTLPYMANHHSLTIEKQNQHTKLIHGINEVRTVAYGWLQSKSCLISL